MTAEGGRAAPAPEPGPGPLRRPLDDPTVCPGCGARLASPRCQQCGLELVGPWAAALLSTSTQAERLLQERDRLVRGLWAATRERAAWAAAAPGPTAAPTASPTGSVPPLRPPRAASPRPVGWPPVPPSAVAPPSRRGGLGVQAILVGLGALLLAVAAIVFLAFSWDVMGLSGRALVVATVTVAVLATSFVARRGDLGATAEAVAAIGVVMVLLDAGAVHATDLLGAGALTWPAFAATAAAVCAVLLAGYGVAAGLRAPTLAAAGLVPLVGPLAGAAAVLAGAGGTGLALGLLGGVLLTGVRETPWVQGDLGAERSILAGAAVALAGAVPPVVAWVAVAAGTTPAAGVAALTAVVLFAQVRPRRGGRGWAAAAGVALGASVVLLTLALRVDWWHLLLAPAAAAALGVLLLITSQRGAAGRPLRGASAGAGVVAAAVALPAAAVVLLVVVGVPVGAADLPWTATVTEDLGTVLRGPGRPGAGSDLEQAVVAATLGLLAGAMALAAVARLLRRRGPATAAAWVVAAALTAVPLQVRAPVVLVVLGGLLLGVLAAGASVTRLARWRPAALTTAVVAGTSAVVVAWTVQELSLPVTLAGAGALVLARRLAPAAGPVLFALATSAALVVVGGAARWSGADALGTLTAAAAAGAAVVAAAALTGFGATGAGRPGSERAGIAIPGALAVLGGLVAAGAPDRPGDAGGVVVALAALLAAAALAPLGGAFPAGVPRVATGLLPAAGAWLALHAAAVWTGWPLPPVAALGTVLAAAGAVQLARRNDPRRTALELGTVGVATVTGLAVLTGADAAAAVLPVALLAVATALLALAPDRRWLSWVALALGTLAWWLRLGVEQVAAVEVYTLPVAAVLLVVALVATWRGDERAGSSGPAVAGLAALVVPSALSGVVGSPWRPASVAVLGLTALAAAVAVRRPGAPEPWRSWGVPLAGAAAAAGLAGLLPRALLATSAAAGGAPTPEVEAWGLLAAALVGGSAACAPRTRRLAPVLALALAVAPTLLAVTGDGPGLARALGVVVAAGAVVALRPAIGGVALATLARALGPVVAAWGLAVGVAGPVEALTVPVAGVLLADGWRHLSEHPGARSSVLLPGLAVLLLPSLLLASAAPTPERVVALTLVATATVVAGSRLALAAPLLGGSAVLAVHALVQLMPWIVESYDAVPRWLVLAVTGALLLALGAQYEARLRSLRTLRERILDLR